MYSEGKRSPGKQTFCSFCSNFHKFSSIKVVASKTKGVKNKEVKKITNLEHLVNLDTLQSLEKKSREEFQVLPFFAIQFALNFQSQAPLLPSDELKEFSKGKVHQEGDPILGLPSLCLNSQTLTFSTLKGRFSPKIPD